MYYQKEGNSFWITIVQDGPRDEFMITLILPTPELECKK